MKTLGTSSENVVSSEKPTDIWSFGMRDKWSSVDEITDKTYTDSEFCHAYSNASTVHLEELLYQDISKTIAAAKKTLPRGKTLESVLTHMVSTLLNHYDEDRGFYYLLIFRVFPEPNKANPQMVKLLDEQLAFIAYFIELLKGKGSINRDLDSHHMAKSIYAIYADVLRAFLNSRKMSVAEAVKEFSSSLKILLAGIEAKAQRKY